MEAQVIDQRPSIGRKPLALGIAGLVLALAAFLPWATITVLGTISVSGTDGGDGWFTLGFGLAAAAFAFAHHRTGKRWALILSLLALAGGFALGVYEVVHVMTATTEVFDTTIHANVALGLWLTVLAPVAGLLAAFVPTRGTAPE
jgi:hypothetical protein